MKRIIMHWTAGTNQPCSTDFEHYHFLVNKDGLITNGKYKPEDNENCTDKKYAQHCGGGNTGAIGISMCGMCGFDMKNKQTKYPLTKVQCEATFRKVAELCKKYKIPVENVQTHYEFGQAHRTTSSFGKIDIIYLHPYPDVKQADVGNFIRSKIKWYLSKI